jgi:hypothetical protein
MFNNMMLIAALVRIMYDANAISTKEAQFVPIAVESAFLGPSTLAVAITKATTGPGVAISSITVKI